MTSFFFASHFFSLAAFSSFENANASSSKTPPNASAPANVVSLRGARPAASGDSSLGPPKSPPKTFLFFASRVSVAGGAFSLTARPPLPAALAANCAARSSNARRAAAAMPFGSRSRSASPDAPPNAPSASCFFKRSSMANAATEGSEAAIAFARESCSGSYAHDARFSVRRRVMVFEDSAGDVRANERASLSSPTTASSRVIERAPRSTRTASQMSRAAARSGAAAARNRSVVFVSVSYG